MIQCPNCKKHQSQVLVRVMQDGINKVVEYQAKCECGQKFSGFFVRP